MEQQKRDNPHVLGLTGSFGSGCSYIAREILQKTMGFEVFSLSEELKLLYKAETQENPETAPRKALQDFGDRIRQERGPDYLASQVIGKINTRIEAGAKPDGWAVDSIRNPAEIRAFRDYSRNFFLLGVYADEEERWVRVGRIKYDDNHKQFKYDDNRDKGEYSEEWGQRVGDCFCEADIVIKNSDKIITPGNEGFQKLQNRVRHYVQHAMQPLSKKSPMREEESLMTMAYAASQRSSCRKRKVGAVIVDSKGNVISSGFNEVPESERPCTEIYNGCYRSHCRDELVKSLESQGLVAAGKGDALKEELRRRFKMLDVCRALHAEENAIVNLARNGRSVPLGECTLYTTTYPCRLCANKIVNLGIRRVVYLEPYPDEEAKAILGSINAEFFEGVTFKAYFKIYGDQK